MTAKVSVYLDERILERLRRRAVAEHGTMRSLSREIEDLARDSFVIDELEAALVEGARGPADHRYGFSDIRPLRIRPGPSPTELVRRAREHPPDVPPRRQRRSSPLPMVSRLR